MYPAAFDYRAPRDLGGVVEALEDLGSEAKILAGGCSLIPMMKLRLAEPSSLVDLRKVAELSGIHLADGRLVIGAMTREAGIESSPLIREHAPLLAETSAVIADPLVRNMGTIGGNAAHADPANDHPATLLALDVELRVTGPQGPRRIPAGSFFVDIFTTALHDGEVLTAIALPARPRSAGWAYVKVERQVGDFAVVAAAVRLDIEADLIRDAAIALTNVGPVAVRAPLAESALVGKALDDEDALSQAAEAAADGLAPWSEQRGSAEYKRRLVPVVVHRALARAAARAMAEVGHVGA